MISINTTASNYCVPVSDAQTKIPDGVTILNPDFKRFLTDSKHTVLPSLGSISNCSELITAITSGVELGEQMERPEFINYSMCLASVLVSGGRAFSTSRFELNNAGRQIMGHLDLNLLHSSLAQRRPSTHYFLSNFQFKTTQVDPLSVKLVTDYFRYDFDILATGNFRQSNNGELLVRFADKAITGSYNSVTILILSWIPNEDTIQITEAIDFLRSTKIAASCR